MIYQLASHSLFVSGNVAIYGLGPFEIINLVDLNEHFEDIKLINDHALNLNEPFKGFPNSLNNLSRNNSFTGTELEFSSTNQPAFLEGGCKLVTLRGSKYLILLFVELCI